MKVYHSRISIEGLLAVPEADRKLFLALAHLQNEIRFLLRVVLWSRDFSSDCEAENQGQFSQSLFFSKLLAGKLREGWEVLYTHYFSQKDVGERFIERADADDVQALTELKKCFGKGNLLHVLRNNFAFHYSPDALENELGKSPDDLDLYLETGPDANTLYYFAEVLANRAALRVIGIPESVEAMDEFMKTILQTAVVFNRFNLAYLHSITSKYKDVIWDGPASEVPLTRLMKYSKVRLPWFLDTTDGLV